MSAAQGRAVQNFGRFDQILIGTAGAAGDHALIGVKFPVADLGAQRDGRLLQAQRADGFLVYRVQQVVQVFVEFPDGIGVGGMEGQSDHRLDRGQVDLDAHVVVRALLRRKREVGLRPAVDGERAAHRLVRLPDGGKAACLRGHDVDPVAVVDAQTGDAVAEEFQHAVFDQPPGEGRGDQRQRHVLRADARARLPGQADADDTGIGNVIGPAQKLLDQLRPALADGKRAVGAVAGVGV